MADLVQALLDAAVERIATTLPRLRECEVHGGRFDKAEMQAFITRAPAVRLACIGLGDPMDVGNGTTWRYDALVVAYCITTDKQGLPRGRAAQAITEAVMRIAAGSRWGLDAETYGEAHACAARNLYSRATGQRGVALWAVEWRQPVTLPALVVAGDEPVPFETYHSDFDLPPFSPAPDAPLPLDAPDAAVTVSLEGDQS